MEQNYQCKFCGSKFHREKTLITHMCVKKRRDADLNSTGSRLGFRAFQRFYELTIKSKDKKSTQDFIVSPFYTEFVKFGNYLAILKPIHSDQYIDFLIKNSVKLKDWIKDDIYYLYIDDLLKKEPAESATERTILEIVNWCEKNNEEFSEFFNKISPNEAAHLIKIGKISPWVLYLSSSAENLINNFNEDHSKMIGQIIDPGFWMKKFKNNNEDVEYIRTLLEKAAL